MVAMGDDDAGWFSMRCMLAGQGLGREGVCVGLWSVVHAVLRKVGVVGGGAEIEECACAFCGCNIESNNEWKRMYALVVVCMCNM